MLYTWTVAGVIGWLAGTPVSAPAALPAQASQLVEMYDVREPAFSPNGDNNQETTTIVFSLSEDSPEFSIFVFRSDSVTVVDTLTAPAPRTAGADSVVWDGTSFDGSPVTEGLYLVTLTALGTAARDTSLTLPVAVDNTPPVISILGAEPGIYAPGLLGTPQIYVVTMVISNTSPTYGLPHLADDLAFNIKNPSGDDIDPLDAWSEPEFSGQNGTYALKWDASGLNSATDGTYSIAVVVADRAGNSAEATDFANVDFEAPKVGFINVAEGAKLSVVPDSLYGWAWDRNGVDSLYIRYSDTGGYVYIPNVTVFADTSFFAALLADSLAEEGVYNLKFRAKDAVAADTGRVSTRGLKITVDRTAPSAPRLEPFDGSWRNPMYTLRGSWTGTPDVIRIYRDGAKIDSLFALLDQSFVRDVPLHSGLNVLTATAVDLTKNESQHSNEVRVTLDETSGLFFPTPFRPNDQFQVNVSRESTGAKVRLFDLAGELVAVLEDAVPGRNFAFPWDGKNGSGDDVKKGPLVVVAEVRYSDGKSEILRKIFLYDPDG
jgi:flagellar hook assembly protein FlgD